MRSCSDGDSRKQTASEFGEGEDEKESASARGSATLADIVFYLDNFLLLRLPVIPISI